MSTKIRESVKKPARYERILTITEWRVLAMVCSYPCGIQTRTLRIEHNKRNSAPNLLTKKDVTRAIRALSRMGLVEKRPDTVKAYWTPSWVATQKGMETKKRGLG